MTSEPGNYVSLSQLAKRAGEGDVGSENVLAKLLLDKALAILPAKLSGNNNTEDREDIALSAVKSFCLGLRSGGIKYQGDKQLFALLHMIVDGKIRKLWQYHFAQKRDVRQVENAEPDFLAALNSTEDSLVAADSIHVTPEEQPAVDRILADLQSELHGLFARLLNDLDEHPRKLLLTMLENDATNKELSEKIGRSVTSVERYRQLIKSKIKEHAK